jgi:hypothetical protein
VRKGDRFVCTLITDNFKAFHLSFCHNQSLAN